MKTKNKNKVAWITAASSSIGKAVVKLLLQNDYIVYAADNRSRNMNDLRLLGAHILKIDPANDSDMQSAIDEIIANEGRIDILFNGAGFSFLNSTSTSSIIETKYQFDNSVLDWERVIELALPYMKKQKYGKIIDVVSRQQKMITSLLKNENTSNIHFKTLSINVNEKPASEGVTIMNIETEIQSDFPDLQNKISFKGLYSKFHDQIEALKISILQNKMALEKENNAIADFLLESITSSSQNSDFKIIPLFFRKLYEGKRGAQKLIKQLA